MTNPGTLSVGVVGLGTASTQVLPFFGKLADIRLGGAADVRPEAREAFTAMYKVPAFDSVEALCRRDDIDAVWVATPNELHAEHVILAASHGKHVICEKPMAINLEQCDRMIAAADANGVKLIQGHSKIYNAPIKKLREIVRSGVLGRVIQIDTWNFNDWLQRPRLPSEVNTAKGGGLCYRQAPHQIDIVRYVGGGLVRSVRSITGRYDPHFDTEGNFSTLMEFEDGTAATLAFNAYGYFDVSDLTWNIGESGKVRDPAANAGKARVTGTLKPDEKYAKMPNYGGTGARPHQPFFGLTVVSCEKGVLRQSPDGIYLYDADGCREVPCDKGSGRGDELVELRDSIREGRAPFPDGRWGKATLEICLAMMQSSRERKEIALQHQTACPAATPETVTA
jgi:phthalate 4,5-cis-dihydrodiol dehydrogenase